MNENDINNIPSENNPMFNEERNEKVSDIYNEPTAPLSAPNNKEPQYGITFNWTNLLIGAFLFFGLFNGSNIFTDDWTFYVYLAVVVIIHELGHVIMGKSFGCHIQEMQVFFFTFLKYRPKPSLKGNSWRDITWSLGVLPLGGVTMFKSRAPGDRDGVYGMGAGNLRMGLTPAASPYIEDKPAWQRLLISAAGVLFNIVTFLILYIAMPHMSSESLTFFWPLIYLSLMLALLNILPIYPLDGGAIVFALYEIITGKKPSPAFTKVCGWIGFIFIILFFWVFPGWLNGIIDFVYRAFF